MFLILFSSEFYKIARFRCVSVAFSLIPFTGFFPFLRQHLLIMIDLLTNVTENPFVFSRVVYNYRFKNYFVSIIQKIFSFLRCFFCKEDINIKYQLFYIRYNIKSISISSTHFRKNCSKREGGDVSRPWAENAIKICVFVYGK